MHRIRLQASLLFVIIATLTLNSIFIPSVYAKDADHGRPGIVVDITKAMIAEKGVMAGATSYAKEKYDDWMWTLIGGYENLVTGNLAGDAYIVQIREKVNNYAEIIDAIQRFILAIEDGRYDDATFIAIDRAVGAIDHPLVSITWEMAKLTYESNKAVQETGAALLVERLYYALNNDRRLFGSQDGQIAQIPEDSQTVDYFFDKYLVTDSNSREMVKAYVQTRLGEEWPEQSWSSWLKSVRTIGSGVDVAEAEEIEALTGEWRNIARKWILSIIKDVNTHARKAYQLVKLNQQKAAFETFAAQYNAFNYDLPRLLEMFTRAGAIRNRLAEYQNKLTTNAAALQKTQGELNKTSNPAVLTSLYGQALDYKREAMNCRVDMFTINEFTLAEEFERLEGQWSVLAKQIDDKTPLPPQTPSAALTDNPEYTSDSEWDRMINSWAVTYFAEILKPIPLPDEGVKAQFRQEFLEKLNSSEYKRTIDTKFGTVQVYNGLEAAAEVQRQWNALRPRVEHHTQNVYSYSSTNPRIYDGIDARMAEVAEEVGPDHILTGGSFGSYLSAVGTVVRSTYHSVIWPTANAYFNDLDQWMSEQITAASLLRSVRATQYAEVMSMNNDMYRYLRQAQIYDRWIENPQGDPYDLSEYIADIIPERLYTYYTGIDYDTFNLNYTLNNQAQGIISGWYDFPYDHWLNLINGFKEAINEAQKINSMLKMPTGTELEEIRYFVVTADTIDQIQVTRNAVNAARNYTSSMLSMINSARQQLETDFTNRMNDANWLRRVGEEWLVWIDAQLQKGYIERTQIATDNDLFRWRLPEGMAIAGIDRVHESLAKSTDGYVMTKDPYPHFMTVTELGSLTATLRAHGNWSASSAYRFVTQYAPEMAERFEEMLQFKRAGNNPSVAPLIRAAEPNMVHPRAWNNEITGLLNTPNIIWDSQLKRAMEIVEGLSYKHSDYEARLTEIRDLLPLTLSYASEAEQTDYLAKAKQGVMVDYTKMSMMINPSYRTPKLIPEEVDLAQVRGYELGDLYADFCTKLKQVIDQERLDRIAEQERESERRSKFYALASQVNSTLNTVKGLIQEENYSGVAGYEGYYQTYLSQLGSLPGSDPDNMVTDALTELKTLFDQAREKAIEAEREQARVLEQVKTFYSNFARAYESRNTSAVLRLIHDDWEAQDGSDTWDLEDTLDRNFRVYDEILYKVSNISVVSDLGGGKYLISYELLITSRIFRRNIRHEEKSMVEEEIQLDSKGAGKILRTYKGRLWT